MQDEAHGAQAEEAATERRFPQGPWGTALLVLASVILVAITVPVLWCEATTRELVVTVVGPDGDAAEGVVVQVIPDGARPDPLDRFPVLAESRSGPDGTVLFPSLHADAVRVLAVFAGRGTVSDSIELAPDGTRFTVKLPRPR